MIVKHTVVDQLIEAMLLADRNEAKTLLDNYGNQNGFAAAASEVLEPSLSRIGEIWETSGNVSLAQAYVAAKVAGDFMESVSLSQEETIEPMKRGTVIIGNIEEDFHSLGRNMVTIFLKKDGWDVCDLGNDVPAEAFVQQAVDLKARFIAISAMMYSTAMNILKVREELDRRNLSDRIKLVVGGAVFKLRPELLKEVGGDATAANAIVAAKVFRELAEDDEGRFS